MSAGILAELERHGFQIRLAGDRIAVSPKDAITDEVRQIIRTNRKEILAVLREGQARPAGAFKPSRDPASPWPTVLPGYGSKTLGPLTHCLLCRAGTWVSYGFLPVCLACARKYPGPPDPKARLSSLLTTWFTMNETAWRQGDVDTIKYIIMDIFDQHPDAEGWFRTWKAAHPEARRRWRVWG